MRPETGMDSAASDESGWPAPASSRIAPAILGLMAATGLLAATGESVVAPSMVVPAVVALAGLAAAAVAIAVRGADRDGRLTGGACLTPVTGGLAIAAVFGLAATVLLPGLVHHHGFDGLIPLVGIAGGLLLLQIVVGPALVRAQAATLPGLVGQRFGRTARVLTLLVAAVTTAGLLVGSLSVALSIAARVFDVPIAVAAAAATAAVLALVLPGGLRSAAAAGALLLLLALLTLFGVLAYVSFAVLGNPVPQLAYGAALKEIAASELALIESGSVDFGVFKPFLREFLTVDSLNWSLLTLALMAAVAALPPLVQVKGIFRGPAATRRGTAWGLTFTILLLTAVPALAALARLETYRVVAAGLTFADVPDWMRRASAADALRIHGVSLGLVEDAARAVTAGADSVAALSAAMASRGTRQETHWQRLDPSVQDAVLAAARTFAADPSAGARWSHFAQTVLAGAARAAGNDTGKPTLASIAIDPELMTLALPAAAGLPNAVSALQIAAVLGAALALIATLVATLSGMVVHDTLGLVRTGATSGATSGATETVLTAIAAVVLTILAATAAVRVPVAADVVLVTSLSLAAAGLMPALVLAIWVPRANAWGLVAALATGLAVCAYYLVGTSLYSVTFYETWSALSNAGGGAFAEFEEARDLWLAAQGEERAAAYVDLAARTSGSLWSPGLANWYGVAPAAAAVLAIPLALLAGILVSVLTPRPKDASRNAFERMHGSPFPRRADGI